MHKMVEWFKSMETNFNLRGFLKLLRYLEKMGCLLQCLHVNVGRNNLQLRKMRWPITYQSSVCTLNVAYVVWKCLKLVNILNQWVKVAKSQNCLLKFVPFVKKKLVSVSFFEYISRGHLKFPSFFCFWWNKSSW